MKYRKKPIVIQAMQYNGKNIEEILSKLDMHEVIQDFMSNDLLIETLEGEMRVSIGDWIIKGIKNEFYPCKPDIFEITYEKVDE